MDFCYRGILHVGLKIVVNGNFFTQIRKFLTNFQIGSKAQKYPNWETGRIIRIKANLAKRSKSQNHESTNQIGNLEGRSKAQKRGTNPEIEAQTQKLRHKPRN